MPKTPRLLAVVLMLLAPLAGVVALAGPAQAGPSFQEPRVGGCRALTFRELGRASNNEAPIRCSQPHTSRVIATGHLPRGVTFGASLQKQQRIATGICDPAFKRAVGSTYRSRAMTAYAWGWFIPNKTQRAHGAKWIRCDLILVGGTSLVRLPTDKQPAVSAPPHPDRIAACLIGQTRAFTTCARTHVWRSTGTFVIHQRAQPTDRQFRRAANRRCPSLVRSNRFAWTFRDANRWRLGDHVVTCYTRTRR